MRARPLPLLLALAAACGSSKQAGPQLDGGLTGASPTGTVEGQAFAAADGGSLVVAPSLCSAISFNLTGLVVAFSSYPSFCSFKRGANACGDHPSSSELIVILARGTTAASGTTPPAFGPGTYPLGVSTGGGVTTSTSVDLRRLGATCGELTTFGSVTGSVTIDQVAPTVKGSLAATFWSGTGGTGTDLGTISGSFDAGPCTLPLDLCGLIAGGACPTPACLP